MIRIHVSSRNIKWFQNYLRGALSLRRATLVNPFLTIYITILNKLLLLLYEHNSKYNTI